MSVTLDLGSFLKGKGEKPAETAGHLNEENLPLLASNNRFDGTPEQFSHLFAALALAEGARRPESDPLLKATRASGENLATFLPTSLMSECEKEGLLNSGLMDNIVSDIFAEAADHVSRYTNGPAFKKEARRALEALWHMAEGALYECRDAYHMELYLSSHKASIPVPKRVIELQKPPSWFRGSSAIAAALYRTVSQAAAPSFSIPQTEQERS